VNGAAWFMMAWMCIWPVIAIVFFLLWLRRVRPPKRRLKWVEDVEDDDE
jgi:hypothetical protein